MTNIGFEGQEPKENIIFNTEGPEVITAISVTNELKQPETLEFPNLSRQLATGNSERFESLEALNLEQREYFSRIITMYPEEIAFWEKNLDPETFEILMKELIGGKGWNTYDMQRKGKNVPDYASITSNVYLGMIEAKRAELEEVFVAGEIGEYTKWSYTEEKLEKASKLSLEILRTYNYPDVVIKETNSIHDRLAQKYPKVVSRSSGEEDMVAASAAGRNATYLNLSTAEELLRATQEVQISQWSIDSLRYSLVDQGADPFKSGVSALQMGYIEATHCAVGFSYELGYLKLNIALGIGETLAQGITSSVEIKVKPEFVLTDLESGAWTNVGDNYQLDTDNGNVITLTIPEQGKAYISNPNPTSIEDKTRIVDVNERLELDLVKKLIPELVTQMRVMTEENGGGQDCEFPIVAQTNPAGEAQIDVYNIQKRSNTSDTEKSTLQLPPKPEVKLTPIFKAPNHLTSNVFSGRLVILDIKNITVPSTGITSEIIVDSSGNPFEKLEDDSYVIYVCKNGTALFDLVLFNQKIPKALYMNTSATAHSCLLIAGEKASPGGGAAILNVQGPNSVADGLTRCNLQEGQLVTVDNEGNIYEGKIPELLNWQEQIDAIRLRNLLDQIENNQELQKMTQVGFNASTFDSARKIHERIGKFINPLLRAEKLDELTRSEDYPNSIDISYIAEQGSDEYKNWFIESQAQEIAQITRLTKETTYRFRGACGIERNGYGVPDDIKENPTKIGIVQGVRENLNHLPAFELECKVIKRALELLGDEKHKLKIMPQFVRTAQEWKEWKKQAEIFGLDFDETKVGSMGEVPTLLTRREIQALASYGCEFISLGTNDMTTLAQAADGRMGDTNSETLNQNYPGNGRALINIYEDVCRVAKELGMSVKICGSLLALYPDLAPWLSEWGVESAEVGNINSASKAMHNNLAHLENKRPLPQGFVLEV